MGASPRKLEVTVEPLARITLQERVYRQVAGLILDGGIAPGQLVTIQGLAEAFQVSAMPVREALKRLTAANALTVVSGRSIGIPPLTMERLTDLRNVRVDIEGLATEWAAARVNDAAISELYGMLAQMDRAIASGDTKVYLQANRALHFKVYETAGSPTLFGIIENLWLQVGPYLNLLRKSGNYKSSNMRHTELVKALEAGDGEAARAAMVADIDEAYDDLLRAMA